MSDEGSGFMCDACCCCYDACDFDTIVFLCVGGGDCLCIRQNVCCAVGAKDRGCGMTTEPDKGEFCKIGCFCCDIGLVTPVSLCMTTSQCLCINSTASFPFHEDYVPECVCAYYCLQCAPKCGCCGKPPPNRALKMLMDRE